MTTTQAARAETFHALHTADRPLALANVWDVASALLVEAAGAGAIATTSAGVAWSLGSPDGDVLGRDRALGLVARVVAAVGLPVTADIEGGYGDDADGVADTVAGVLAAGAVGVNIEDGPRPPAEAAARVAAARRAADRAGVRLFVNARVDTFLTGSGGVRETLDRARRYVEAGADGVFVPGVADAETITALARGIAVPLNVMAAPGTPPLGQLGTLGVARVSLGSGIAQSAYAAARRAAEELFSQGSYHAVGDGIAYPELDALLRAGGGGRGSTTGGR
ncbi:isocitrate lyase/phosphoenolpyruvate mutase family protein [uncultured Streptomyces sp.]|uniref:isocitrate lyase/PEP mutase family protein n=1 Tax=uncultured Streptomyces sp. TaxID=174707 RepID=UPI002633A84B|nr:isocitrate lyase/phosphoenolpyruvate mutase family protein [uncultured Streptomyces sp.]